MKNKGIFDWARFVLTALTAICLASFAQAEDEGEEYAYLGVYVESIPEMLGEHLGLQPGVGVVVEGVIEGGPAEVAGLKKNDLLLKFDDQILIGTKQAVTLVRISEPGSEHVFSIMRKGEKQELTVKLGAKKKSKEKKKPADQSSVAPAAPVFPAIPKIESKHAIRSLKGMGGDGERIVFIGEGGEIDIERSMELNEDIETMVERVQLAVTEANGISAPTIVVQGEERVFEFLDDSGASYTIVDSDGESQLRIVNADGKAEFEGLLTDDSMTMLPDSLRKELPRIQKMVRIEKLDAPVWVSETESEESF